MATCTIVTAYYPVRGKHDHSEYRNWIARFLPTVTTPMVIFTDAATAPMLEQLRGTHPTRVIIQSFETLRFAAPRFLEYWRRDHARDHERHIHNPHLYIIWNEKTAFVQRAIEFNPFNTEFYTWCDIGMMRESSGHEIYSSWPSPESLAPLDRDRIYLLEVESFQAEDSRILPNGLPAQFVAKNRVGGGVLLGSKHAWSRWIPAYYNMVEAFMAADYFAGKDQSIMNTLAITNPDLIHLVRPEPYMLGGRHCGDRWFYMLWRFK